MVNDKHTADNIRSVVSVVLDEFGAVRPGYVFITDNASNMKAAFRDHTWLGCACHNLNIVLSHGLQEAPATEQCTLPHEVTELIDACKEVVTLAKRTRLNCQLETSLKQCVVTRWNSVLTTLISVSVNLAELQRISISNEDKSNRYSPSLCYFCTHLLALFLLVFAKFIYAIVLTAHHRVYSLITE